jgi:hypothetical protein
MINQWGDWFFAACSLTFSFFRLSLLHIYTLCWISTSSPFVAFSHNEEPKQQSLFMYPHILRVLQALLLGRCICVSLPSICVLRGKGVSKIQLLMISSYICKLAKLSCPFSTAIEDANASQNF